MFRTYKGERCVSKPILIDNNDPAIKQLNDRIKELEAKLEKCRDAAITWEHEHGSNATQTGNHSAQAIIALTNYFSLLEI